MKIKGKSIRNLNRVLKAAGELKEVKLVYKVDGRDSIVWEQLGFRSALVVGHYLIPSVLGKITSFNARGAEIVRKDLPKQPESVTFFGSSRDWHGGIHYGIRTRTMQKYPREFVPAPSEAFYVSEINGELYLTTSVINLVEEDEVRNLHVCNLMLECFGEFEIYNSEKDALVGPKLKRVQWEILPRGEYPWSKSKSIIDAATRSIDKKEKEVVDYRMKTIAKFNPDFLATGQGGFSGYFVYGFEKIGVYVLESIYLDNATYVFDDDWEAFSQLTKSEIINGGLAKARIVHDRKWAFAIRNELNAIKI
ncbi:hypothetical protein RH824_000009 [Vibrio parahaemolyticus]|uniref:hypothetical protein n=1 Tax=Vibrio diabolicus TaxID=50719 RepID=UPI001D6720FF|nr:hypothetical protein [Vibrio parahaemolyticus]ELP6741498.1 hypothetical protein [Vibrio vulnificus]EGR1322203.1 hypothetical protein [Vibrio parahaemolyticus]EIB6362654.1 hypothetical protein [Vibrio parahaemolyticus]EIF5068282.1 hypothetical protein [Vibrio parahaemolyticus]